MKSQAMIEAYILRCDVKIHRPAQIDPYEDDIFPSVSYTAPNGKKLGARTYFTKAAYQTATDEDILYQALENFAIDALRVFEFFDIKED